DDTTAPKISANYDVSYNRSSFAVRVNVSDTQSGVRTVKYAPGEQNVDYFRSGNQGITLNPVDGLDSFSVKEGGIYTIYAADYRGNKTVQTIDLRIVPAATMALATTKKTLVVGDSFSLLTTLTPVYTTDKLQFSSSKTSVCKVSASGKITAIAPGKSTITVTTSGGIRKKCVVTVKAAK
ncbi:MAG: Ig-like domain-containing protein, partial [Lachnospiraceae bacterium]|nr:Ig-like domain-containing protein [Lachnospiraceae bacterium]